MFSIGIVPARMDSSRFPGKPLQTIQDIAMVAHCVKRAEMCTTLNDAWVATCDQEIYDYVIKHGSKAIMTSTSHQRASDRAAEAMLKIEAELSQKIDVCVMLQGDEPMTTPSMIERAIEPMRSEDINVVNLMTKIKTTKEFNDPNEVKVVVDEKGYAMYFSREPIPSRKKGASSVPMLKQICVIPFKRDYLIKFNSTSETKLEVIESVDMLRVLETGEKIKMIEIEEENCSVDTYADLEKVRLLMQEDPLVDLYRGDF